MTWNYRMVFHENPDKTKWIGIHEVFYREPGDEDYDTNHNNLLAYAEVADISTDIDDIKDPSSVKKAKESLLWIMDKMKEAIEKDILTLEDFDKKG